MRNWLRRLRGAFGMGVTWAVALSLVGGIPRWVFGVNTDAPLPLLFGMFGFIAGVTFSVILALAAGRRRFEEMSLPRFAVLGAFGGLLLSAVFVRGAIGVGEVIAIPIASALACAACAAGSLALARRGERRELPEPAADSIEAEVGGNKRNR